MTEEHRDYSIDALEAGALGLHLEDEKKELRSTDVSGDSSALRTVTPKSEQAKQTAPEEEARRPSEKDGYKVPQWRREAPKVELFGLALSGGGIRSATFNLGLLQGLDRLGFLPAFHYLATVSGGGYVGAFWTAWMGRAAKDRQGGFPQSRTDEPEAREVRHLREFSNFLNPRLLLFSFETGRVLAAFLGAVLPSLLLAFSSLLAVLLVWLAAVWLLWSAPGLLPALGLQDLFWTDLSFALLTLALQVGLEALWRRRPEEDRATPWYVLFMAAGLLASGLLWGILWWFRPLDFGRLLLPWQPGWEGSHAGTLLLPSLAWVGGAVALLLLRVFVHLGSKSNPGRRRVGALDRALSRYLLAVAGWAVLALVWTGGQWLAVAGVGGIASAFATGTVGGSVFGWLRRLLGTQVHKPTGGQKRLLLLPWLLKVLVWLVIGAFGIAAAALLVKLGHRFGGVSLPRTSLLILVVLLLACWLFKPEANGFHAFYRARLVRAYLGASNELGSDLRHATDECDEDDRQLKELPKRPLHLVCCTANNLSGDPLATLNRGGESAVLTRGYFQVGSQWLAHEDLGAPTIGQAITASGAALNSHMGDLSVHLGRASSFVLTALGMRLGLWMPNALVDEARKDWNSTNPKVLTRGREGDGEPEPSSHGAGEGTEPGRKRRDRWPGFLFFRELFGCSSTDSKWIHLSDGGHFENLALYELVRRHCRFILLSDCGADPDRAFDDFGNAVRRIREDFGVEINIDIEALRPGDDGLSPQPVVAGDICYGPNDHGVLLYIKPTLTGNEPPDVVHYAGRNKAFPHETTLDQFYDEAQWESYRRLGAHAVERAFKGLEENRTRAVREDGAAAGLTAEDVRTAEEVLTKVFLEARYRWVALPTEVEDPTASLGREWTRLEEKMVAEPLIAREIVLPLASQGSVESAPEETKNGAVMDPEELPGAGEGFAEGLPDPEKVLPLVQEAVRIMEEVFFRLHLDTASPFPAHHRSLAWLNRFGRWTGAPAFRAWWPWLAPLHNRRFVAFLEDELMLPSAPGRTGVVKPMHLQPVPARGGLVLDRLALHRWQQQERPQGEDDAPAECAGEKPSSPSSTKGEPLRYSIYGYEVPFGPHCVNLAVVRIRRCGEGTATWRSRDLFVPPGFWGVGVGQHFLEKLLPVLAEEGYRVAEVQMPEDGHTPPDLEALYVQQGFCRRGRSFVRNFPGEPAGPTAAGRG